MQKLLFLLPFVFIMTSNSYAEEHHISFEGNRLGTGMQLSSISDSYENVTSGGGWSFQYLRQKNSWFRIGGGGFSLRGNKGETDVGVDGGGMISEFFLPMGGFEALTNIQLGGSSVTVTHKETGTNSDSVESGTFTQGGGWLVSPAIGIGYNFPRTKIYVVGKRTQFISGSPQIMRFSHNNYGMGVARKF